MAKNLKSDWIVYWSRFKDLDLLQTKSFNLDETLLDIEKEVGFKLLSGDQMLLIIALEDRIRELSKVSHDKKVDVQVNLFD